MASQALNKIEFEPSHPVLPREILPGPNWAPYQAPVRKLDESEYLSEADSAGGSCMKGFFVGLILEVVCAMSAYGVWRVWHLPR